MSGREDTPGPGARLAAKLDGSQQPREPRPRVPSTPEREDHFSGAITAGTDILVDTQHVRDLAPLAAPCAKRQAAGGAVTDDDDPARVAEQPNQQGAATATMAGPAPRIAVEPGAQQACHTDWFSQSACRRPSVMRRAVPSGIADASRLSSGDYPRTSTTAPKAVWALCATGSPPTASRAGPVIADGSVLAFGSRSRRKNRPDLPTFATPSALTQTSEWSSNLGAMRARGDGLRRRLRACQRPPPRMRMTPGRVHAGR